MKYKPVRLWLLFSFFFLLLLAPPAVQPTWAAPATQPVPLELRTLDPEKLQALQGDKDFTYYQDVRPDLSFWERFWRKVGDWLSKLFGGKSNSGPNLFWKYFSYAFLLGVTVFVILKLLKVDFVYLFGRKTTKMAIPYETYSEDIHELDFQALIDEAEAQGDYRRAIRLYYLRLLKTLSDQELILWTPSKTNRTYVAELKSSQLRQPFERVTGLFEYIWYGGSALNQERFATVRQSFQEFTRNITAKP